MMPNDVHPSVPDQVKDFYLNGKFDHENPLNQMTELTKMISDWVWGFGFHNAVSSHSKHVSPSTPLFLYHYEYLGEFSLDQLLLALRGEYHPIIEILWMKISNYVKSNILGQTIPRYGKFSSSLTS